MPFRLCKTEKLNTDVFKLLDQARNVANAGLAFRGPEHGCEWLVLTVNLTGLRDT